METNLQTIDERLKNIENALLSNKKVLNFAETAIYTGLSKSHLYKLTSTGGIPCYKPQGKFIYFDRDELDAWMLRNRRATNEEIEAKAANYLVNNK
ncbi:MAG: helix-turn-helix transcriptional regulator [Cyclobacteriaceae bacterium]